MCSIRQGNQARLLVFASLVVSLFWLHQNEKFASRVQSSPVSQCLQKSLMVPPNEGGILKDSYTICMMKDESELKAKAHPGCPFYSLPAFDQLLHPTSATTSICNQRLENLHVLVILSQPLVSKTRSAIRATYANFPFRNSETSITGNWTRMFLVGRPKNQLEEFLLKKASFFSVTPTHAPTFQDKGKNLLFYLPYSIKQSNIITVLFSLTTNFMFKKCVKRISIVHQL